MNQGGKTYLDTLFLEKGPHWSCHFFPNLAPQAAGTLQAVVGVSYAQVVFKDILGIAVLTWSI